jgi:predicted Zn-dependent protease
VGLLLALALVVLAGLCAVLVAIVMPRTAHLAFERGQLRAARFRYAVLARLSTSRQRRGAARVSIAACWLAADDIARAERALARVDEGALDGAARAAWLNNRAYAALRGGADPSQAMAWVDEAARLRPDVPGIVHTRGLALLAGGKLDDAIRAFEDMWELGELPPRLEAERCRDLARAWEAKGHGDYAADYRARAAKMGGPHPEALPPPPSFELDEE